MTINILLSIELHKETKRKEIRLDLRSVTHTMFVSTGPRGRLSKGLQELFLSVKKLVTLSDVVSYQMGKDVIVSGNC